MLVALTAAPSLCNNHFRCVMIEIGKHLFGLSILDDRTYRYENDLVFGILAALVAALAVLAAVCLVLAPVAQIDKGIQLVRCTDDDMAAATAVAAVRTAFRHILLPAETDAPAAAVA